MKFLFLFIRGNVFGALSLCLLLAACAKDQPSGLMGDPQTYAALEQTAAGPKVNFVQPGILKNYNAYYVAPVEIYTGDSGRLISATDRELEDLAKTFRERVIRELGDRYTMFNQPAKDTAIIKIAITDVWSNHTLTNLRPGLIIPNALGGGASMEAEIVDSVSRRRVALITDSRAGERKGFMSGLTKWGGTEAAFDDWAALLKRSIRKGGA